MLNYNFSEDMVNDALDLLEDAKESGKIKKGANEVTKAITRKNAKLVFIAGDAKPLEIILHFPKLSEKNGKIPFIVVPSGEKLGEKAGIGTYTAAAAIIDSDNSKLESMMANVSEISYPEIEEDEE